MSDLEARAAIADLVHGYARNIRGGKGADCASLFTSDGVFEIRDAPLGSSEAPTVRTRLEGQEAIRAYLTGGAASEVRVCPMIHNLMIQVDGGQASSDCVMEAITSNGLRMFGEYHDRYLYEDGWRFVSRIYTIFGQI